MIAKSKKKLQSTPTLHLLYIISYHSKFIHRSFHSFKLCVCWREVEGCCMIAFGSWLFLLLVCKLRKDRDKDYWADKNKRTSQYLFVECIGE